MIDWGNGSAASVREQPCLASPEHRCQPSRQRIVPGHSPRVLPWLRLHLSEDDVHLLDPPVPVLQVFLQGGDQVPLPSRLGHLYPGPRQPGRGKIAPALLEPEPGSILFRRLTCCPVSSSAISVCQVCVNPPSTGSARARHPHPLTGARSTVERTFGRATPRWQAMRRQCPKACFWPGSPLLDSRSVSSCLPSAPWFSVALTRECRREWLSH